MIDLKGIMGIPLLKKTRFTGSEKGLNFVLEKVSGEDGAERLAATCWHGRFCSDATPDEEKTTEYFSFDDEGLKKAQEWLNTQV